MLVVLVLFSVTLLGHGRETGAFRYVSEVFANGKPILRSIPRGSESESREKPNNREEKEPDWLKRLRKNIFFALNGYGLEESKPYIRQLVEGPKSRVVLREWPRDWWTKIEEGFKDGMEYIQNQFKDMKFNIGLHFNSR